MNGHKPTYKGPRDLPIYTASYKLLEVVDRIFDNFTRDRKHTLGQTLYNTVLDITIHRILLELNLSIWSRGLILILGISNIDELMLLDVKYGLY